MRPVAIWMTFWTIAQHVPFLSDEYDEYMETPFNLTLRSIGLAHISGILVCTMHGKNRPARHPVRLGSAPHDYGEERLMENATQV